MRLDPHDNESLQEFFILPTGSYFGDYQILFDVRSQIIYKNISNKVLICLCISRNKLIELMDDYPEARKIYIERAWLRRIEFRRRQKAFVQALEQIDFDEQNQKKPFKDDSTETEDSSLLSEESIKSDDEALK